MIFAVFEVSVIACRR